MKLKVKTILNNLFKEHTKTAIAQKLGIKYQALQNWILRNEMPATEYNGKTFYSLDLEELTEGKVKVEDLLGFEPHPVTWERERRAQKKVANG